MVQNCQCEWQPTKEIFPELADFPPVALKKVLILKPEGTAMAAQLKVMHLESVIH